MFIYVKKAFDSINHGAIIQALRSSGVPEILVGYIEDLYLSSTTRIIAGSEVSSPVLVARGVKQGDPMSPFLFNLGDPNIIKSPYWGITGVTDCQRQQKAEMG